MRRKALLLIGIVLFGVFVTWAVSPQAVEAECTDYYCTDCDNPKLDYDCQQRRLVDPAENCTLLYCGDDGGQPGGDDRGESPFQINFFGVWIRLNSQRAVESILLLLFSGVLGLVAVAATLMGVFAAFKRAQADDADAAATASKTMVNAVIGVIIVGMSLLIVQLIGQAIGVGTVLEMVSFSEEILSNTAGQ